MSKRTKVILAIAVAVVVVLALAHKARSGADPGK